MATITRAFVKGPGTTTQDLGPHQIKGRAASGGLVAGDMVYIVNSSGQPILTKADGTAATAPALSVGMVMDDCPAGEKCVALHGVEVQYATGMTAGARLYVSATAGALDDGATTGGTVPVAIVTTSTTIYLIPPTR